MGRPVPGVRVVTHAEELRTLRDPAGTTHDDAVFRVYAWVTDPDSYTGPQTLSWPNAIVLDIPGVDLQPCGGTHVRQTAEIGPMKIGKVEKKGRHNRRVNVLFADAG